MSKIVGIEETEEELQSFKERVNLLFTIFNLAEDIFFKILPSLKYEFKLSANRSIKEMNKFNRLIERVFNEEKLNNFDNDKRTLEILIECSNRATEQDVHDEFLKHVRSFFLQENIRETTIKES